MSEESLVIRKGIVEYLHTLRRTGATNMLSAGPYLERDFGIERREAKEIAMNYTFGTFTIGEKA